MTFLKKAGVVSALYALISLPVFAADYYVATSGDDTLNTGGQSDPFKTIGKAVSIMVENDTCYVRGGTYRETVDFDGKKGLVIKAVDGEQVTLSGLDEVKGPWTNESGNLWYAPVDGLLTRSITINEGLGDKERLCGTFESQVYKDDKVQFLARWPNKQSTDYDKLMNKDWHSMTVEECKASKPESFMTTFPADWTAADLDGAYLWGLVQNEWSSWMAPVTGYNPATRKMTLRSFYENENDLSFWIKTKHNPNIKDRGTYFGHIIVLGAKVLLDDDNEFFTDFANKRLYVYSSVDPALNSYEVKTRHYAFILPSTSENITIEGIDVRAATMQLSGRNCVIKRSTLDFPSYGYAPYRNEMAKEIPGLANLKLKGSGNILRDSTIENCFGGAFEVTGSDNVIHNSLARNVNTMASWHSGFIVSGIRNTVSHSTVYKVGRSGFSVTNGRNCRVIYNDVSDVGYLTDDLGGLHSSRDTQNTEIAYNWFHDIQTGHAIYMDNYNSHYIVHHNVVWNTYGLGVNHNRPSNHSFIINNTVFENGAGASKSGWTGCIGQIFGPWADKGQQDPTYGSMWFNNLSRNGVKRKGGVQYGFVVNNNTTLASNRLNKNAFDPTVHKLPEARDTGIYVKGITSDFVKDGKPDMGAYEITSTDPKALWKAGHDFNTPPALPAFKDSKLVFRNLINNGTFYYSKADTVPEGWDTSSNTGDSILVKLYTGYNDPPANARNSVLTKSLTVLSAGADTTYVERKVTGLETDKHYNFSAYIRLFPHGNAAAGVDDVTLYVKDSKGNQLGTTTVKTFKNYTLNNRSTRQGWFMTEVPFELTGGESEITIGFSTNDAGTFFVENVGVARKFSLAPVVESVTIPGRAVINTPTAFTASVTDSDSSIDHYKWTIDGSSYEGSAVNHTFTQTADAVNVSFVAVDEFGVESMPVARTIEVLTEIPPTLTVSEVILDTQDINASPIVIQPSIQVDVDYSGAEYDKLALYVGTSDPVSLTTPVFEKRSLTDFLTPHKLFMTSDSLKDGVTYYYTVAFSGSGKPTIKQSGSFTLDRMNMVPFTDSRALTHLASSDRRLTAGSISRWQNLLNRQADYDAVATSASASVKADANYTVKGMNSILFNNSGMKINTPSAKGVSAFIAARRQKAEVDLGGDKHQRIVSVLGSTLDYGQEGAWLEIKRDTPKSGLSIAFGPELITKRNATFKQGPIFLGRYAKSEAYRYIGEMFEVVVFDEPLSDSEAAVVSKWLTDKWSGASFPQPALDWDGDGITNADEIAAGTDPSVKEKRDMDIKWFSAIQNKKKKKLWWTVRVEKNVKEYKVTAAGQADIIVAASKPDGGLYYVALPTTAEVDIAAIGITGDVIDYDVFQQDGGASAPSVPPVIDEKLPSILVIGDSISIGYDAKVRSAMSGEANIVHNPGNAADTRYGVKKIDEWLYREWDVIHFNWGLHDLKRLDNVNVGVEIPDYKSNLQFIVGRMRALNPKAKLIFATTTPYPDNVSPMRLQADAVNYNNAAKEVMTTHNIEINDLHALMMSKLDTNNDGKVTNAEDTQNLQIDTNVHFKSSGSQVLANAVVAKLRSGLSGLPAAPQIQTLAASEIGKTIAKLNGRLSGYGNAATDVWVYWGDNDGASDKNNWDHSHKLATAVTAVGDYSYALSSLTENTTYHFRFYAQNSNGAVWGDTKTFVAGLNKATLSVETDLHITVNPGKRVSGYSQLIVGDRLTNGDCRAFIKFDMTPLPKNYKVTKAMLRLYHIAGADDDKGEADVYNINADWTTASVSYNQSVSTEKVSIFNGKVGSKRPKKQYIDIDVTSLMQHGSHYGFAIRGPEIGADGSPSTKTASYFHSAEGTNKPQLVVEYTESTSPARGVSVLQTGKLVEWTVEEELNVKAYRLIDQNGHVIETIAADGSKSYALTLDELVKVSLVIVDADGSTQTFESEDGNIISVNYKLKKGWNLIAVPGDNTNLKKVKEVAVGSLWTWDGEKYVRTRGQKAYEGLWVFVKTAVNIRNVSGTKSDPVKTLTSGWNLAGPANNVAVPDKVEAVFSYQQKYENILKHHDLLYKGIGYWFFVTGETDIELNVK